MSIKNITMYAVQCDHEGCTTSTNDLGGDYSAWTDTDTAVIDWNESDCQTIVSADGTESHYCYDHRVPTCIHCDRPAELTAIGTGMICITCLAS